MFEIMFFVFKWFVLICCLYLSSGNSDVWHMSILMVISIKLIRVCLKHMSRA